MKYQQIGDILIFNKISKKKAIEFLVNHKNIKTICIRKGPIKGQFRKPQIKVLASCAKKDKTITLHKEQGIIYKLDVSKIMFAKGNINERHRLAKIAKKNEIVVDMFAGIGYFTLPLAKKVKKVYAIELNPVSFKYLQENIKLNKLKNIVAFKGDCAKIVPRLKIKADRIVMGFLPSPFPYLKAAFKIAKKGTIIHYSCLIKRRDEQSEITQLVNKINKIRKVKLIRAIKVKSFSPSKDHVVFDLVV
ncbi:MAG: RsmD family RNA methyltransferase [Candidatus Pacearchaeota archaeon]|nr:RsmD family RNA methyltransferase [Candidatus Pacearchaeota archaeon]